MQIFSGKKIYIFIIIPNQEDEPSENGAWTFKCPLIHISYLHLLIYTTKGTFFATNLEFLNIKYNLRVFEESVDILGEDAYRKKLLMSY
jgi:hypothetical protein